MTYDVTPIVQSVVALVAVLISSLLIPWIKSKTTQAQQDDLKQWVKIGVAAAEQVFVGQGRGAEKKEWVLAFLAKHKLTVDMEAIDALIESAVWELNNL